MINIMQVAHLLADTDALRARIESAANDCHNADAKASLMKAEAALSQAAVELRGVRELVSRSPD